MRRVNLIPMAGAGQRFVDAGYKTPKALIPVDGLPMVVRAARCLPPADEWIFICREEHIERDKIDIILQDFFPNSVVLKVGYLTEGQAITCLLAKELLQKDDRLTIGACDNGMNYKLEEFNTNLDENDALIWTFRNNPTVLTKPEMYGWVEVNQNLQAVRVSCKTAISQNPIEDHAIIGAFSFNQASTFLDCVQSMIEKNRRINNEFYMDVALDECIRLGYSVSITEVTDYFSWGTPLDLESYQPS